MTNQENQTSGRKRKRLFVDSKVQGSLVRQLILHWVLVCFLIFFYLFSLQAMSTGFAMGFTENARAVCAQYGILGLVLLVLSPVFIYDSMKLSNRFVGPMVSFRNALRQLADGENPSDLKFRKNDFWKDLTKDLNAINKELTQLRAQVASSEAAASSNAQEKELAERAS